MPRSSSGSARAARSRSVTPCNTGSPGRGSTAPRSARRPPGNKPWAGDTDALSERIAAFLARLFPGPRAAATGTPRTTRPLAGWGSLTDAEQRVADLAAAGLSNPEIAAQLYLSRSTVETHLKR